jgi:hypothetical protein
MTGKKKQPTAVKALIDAAVVRIGLKRMGVHQTGPAQLRGPDQGGTRKNGR